MDWYDVADDEWLAAAFGDVNSDGYHDGVESADDGMEALRDGFSPCSAPDPADDEPAHCPDDLPTVEKLILTTTLDFDLRVGADSVHHLTASPW